jgi:hypothetical protein
MFEPTCFPDRPSLTPAGRVVIRPVIELSLRSILLLAAVALKLRM